jgi:tungstate transport system ATP-binding protein
MSAEPLFRLEEVGFSYRERLALELPLLELQEGQATVVTGPNGSGKTTLLKLLNGLLTPSQGRVLYRGRALSEGGLERVRTETVLVHQDPYLFDGSVFQNVAYGPRLRGLRGAALRLRVTEELRRVGLEGFGPRRSRRLSGGEKQRVAIARALALEPRVLLLDEPTANVDRQSTELIEALVLSLQERGTTVILSSHNPAFAYRLAERLLCLDQGRIVPVAENVLRGGLESTDERFSYFRTGEARLRCPAQEGQFTTAVFSLDDVILSTEPVRTSAQNQFAGTVVRIERDGRTARVSLECGFPVQARITEHSLESLQVLPGSRFYVTFKASAIRLY